MKVRFAAPPRQEAGREDGLRMRMAASRRPRRPYWQWYLLLAMAAAPVLAGGLALLRRFACGS